MLRKLIENGACVYAQTLSTSETAAELFDNSNEYGAAVEYIDMVEKCMGSVNNEKVILNFFFNKL